MTRPSAWITCDRPEPGRERSHEFDHVRDNVARLQVHGREAYIYSQGFATGRIRGCYRSGQLYRNAAHELPDDAYVFNDGRDPADGLPTHGEPHIELDLQHEQKFEFQSSFTSYAPLDYARRTFTTTVHAIQTIQFTCRYIWIPVQRGASQSGSPTVLNEVLNPTSATPNPAYRVGPNNYSAGYYFNDWNQTQRPYAARTKRKGSMNLP